MFFFPFSFFLFPFELSCRILAPMIRITSAEAKRKKGQAQGPAPTLE